MLSYKKALQKHSLRQWNLVRGIWNVRTHHRRPELTMQVKFPKVAASFQVYTRRALWRPKPVAEVTLLKMNWKGKQKAQGGRADLAIIFAYFSFATTDRPPQHKQGQMDHSYGHTSKKPVLSKIFHSLNSSHLLIPSSSHLLSCPSKHIPHSKICLLIESLQSSSSPQRKKRNGAIPVCPRV